MLGESCHRELISTPLLSRYLNSANLSSKDITHEKPCFFIRATSKPFFRCAAYGYDGLLRRLILFCGEVLVHLHQLGDTCRLGVEPATKAVGFHDGSVVGLVRLAQLWQDTKITFLAFY